ncbi:glycosyltransferase [Mesorhizobium sp. KR1-2]|uniref:glycosyltransferase family 4 protein n=1 Tax=Mesorhizobium sp. KR1-2 TaxID=3156609 RepID=UPI0032B6100B
MRYYLPGYKSGGPVRTITNMVAALGDELDFRLVTSDRDATDTMPYPDLGVDRGWLEVGKAKVLYLSPSQIKLRNIARIIGDIPHDTLYLNSFFDPTFTLKPLLARRLGLAPKMRCVIAPRGEFSEGALKLKSARKKAFLWASGGTGLYSDLEWHASSVYEEADIQRALGASARKINVASDLPGMTPGEPPAFSPRAADEPLRIIFLSRISPMKNLDFALQMLRQVKIDVQFDVYGAANDNGYLSRCLSLMKTLPSNISAKYKGPVDHRDVINILSRYDLFLLPTLGENYGHVIYEALAAGTPVLISDTTPWGNLVGAGVGWELPLGKPEAFAEKIERAAELTGDEHKQMRIRAALFAKKHSMDMGVIDANRRLLGQGKF